MVTAPVADRESRLSTVAVPFQFRAHLIFVSSKASSVGVGIAIVGVLRLLTGRTAVVVVLEVTLKEVLVALTVLPFVLTFVAVDVAVAVENSIRLA